MKKPMEQKFKEIKLIGWIEIQFSYMFLYNTESFCNRDY